jgi:hypothetical protein
VYPLAALLGLVAPLAALVAFAVLPPFFIADAAVAEPVAT